MLVTGSSSGIGRATAVAFAREGALLTLTYCNNREGAEETARMVAAVGGDALVVPYDLADAESIRFAVQASVDRWGALHVLVNNAVQWAKGGHLGTPLFEAVRPEQWRPMLDTALAGVYLTIQAAVPHMRTERWGRIVNLSSNLAVEGMPGGAAYTAAKAGLHGLSRTLAQELGPAGILTNVVMPGLTVTERTAEVLPQAVLDQVAAKTPTKRLTTSDEVASLIVYLASAANGHVNGAIIPVTGGL